MNKTVTLCTQVYVCWTILWFTTINYRMKIKNTLKLKREFLTLFMSTFNFIETKSLIFKVNCLKVIIHTPKKYTTLWCPLLQYSNWKKFKNLNLGNQLLNVLNSWMGIKLLIFSSSLQFITVWNKNSRKAGIEDSKKNYKHLKNHNPKNIPN